MSQSTLESHLCIIDHVTTRDIVSGEYPGPAPTTAHTNDAKLEGNLTFLSRASSSNMGFLEFLAAAAFHSSIAEGPLLL